MRILLVTLSLFLSACAVNDNPPATVKQGGTVASAQAACLKRGLKPGTYNYDTCYRQRPEVQTVERNNRMRGLGIIHNNKSVYTSARGRSYPVD